MDPKPRHELPAVGDLVHRRLIDDLEEGRLVRVLPDYTAGQIAIHVVFPSRRFLPARVRVLDAAITTHFAARAARCHVWLQDNQPAT